MIKYRNILLLVVLLVGLNACYYDNVEYLYPSGGECDTTNVTYTNDVWPIINSKCTGCHSGAAPSGNVKLENYSDIKTSGENGGLLGTIRHDNAWSPMPKGGSKISDCNILKIETWQSQGYPNN